MVIKKVEIFHTPKDQEELVAWIDLHSSDERAHLWTAAMMAWNLAVQTVENEDEQT